jgi:hypothetical protein
MRIPTPPEPPPEPPVFHARWTAPATWHVRAPGCGWMKAPGVWKQDEASFAVRRVFGHGATRALGSWSCRRGPPHEPQRTHAKPAN